MTAREFETLWGLVISANGDRHDIAAMLAAMFSQVPRAARDPHVIEERAQRVLAEVGAGQFNDTENNIRQLASLLGVSFRDLGLERRRFPRAS